MKGYEKITNPVTGRKVSVYGKTGQQIINSYINHAQSGGDATPHMGARPQRRRGPDAASINAAQTAQVLNSGTTAVTGHAAPVTGRPADTVEASAISLSVIAPVAQNIRPKATNRDIAPQGALAGQGFKRGEPYGPMFPDALNSRRMAEVLQHNSVNKTKDQINFVANVDGQVSADEKAAFEDALEHGDGSGFIDFPGLKLLFRGVLFDFLMRDGKIIFQVQHRPEVHSKCQSRQSRRLDGSISYQKAKGGKIVLTQVSLERGKQECWPKKLPRDDPIARASL